MLVLNNLNIIFIFILFNYFSSDDALTSVDKRIAREIFFANLYFRFFISPSIEGKTRLELLTLLESYVLCIVNALIYFSYDLVLCTGFIHE